MTDYSFILSKIYPGKQWSMSGDDYKGLVWLDEGDQPTQEQLDQEYADYRKQNDYIFSRENAYLNAGLTLEKLVVDMWEKEVEGNPASSIATQAIREQIKLQYPKPVLK